MASWGWTEGVTKKLNSMRGIVVRQVEVDAKKRMGGQPYQILPHQPGVHHHKSLLDYSGRFGMACARVTFIVSMGQFDCLRTCITLMIKNTRISRAFPFPMHAILPFVPSSH